MIGWFVLLAITFAATDPEAVTAGEGYGAGSSLEIFSLSLRPAAFKAVVLISTIGQLFCGLACLTSASRMCFAFARDRGLPGLGQALEGERQRHPAQRGDRDGGRRADDHPAGAEGQLGRRPVPVRVLRGRLDHRDRALHRLRDPDLPALAQGQTAFEQSPAWNLGSKWRWMNPFAVFWVGMITIIFCLPFTPAAVPWNDEFSWEAVNYAPITVGVVFLFAAIPGS